MTRKSTPEPEPDTSATDGAAPVTAAASVDAEPAVVTVGPDSEEPTRAQARRVDREYGDGPDVFVDVSPPQEAEPSYDEVGPEVFVDDAEVTSAAE